MTFIDSLGLVAGALTTISFIPQVLKIWVSKSAEDVSYLMFGVFSVGVTRRCVCDSVMILVTCAARVASRFRSLTMPSPG